MGFSNGKGAASVARCMPASRADPRSSGDRNGGPAMGGGAPYVRGGGCGNGIGGWSTGRKLGRVTTTKYELAFANRTRAGKFWVIGPNWACRQVYVWSLKPCVYCSALVSEIPRTGSWPGCTIGGMYAGSLASRSARIRFLMCWKLSPSTGMARSAMFRPLTLLPPNMMSSKGLLARMMTRSVLSNAVAISKVGCPTLGAGCC